MGRKRIPGLYKRRGTWHIDKQIFGRRILENTGTNSIENDRRHDTLQQRLLPDARSIGRSVGFPRNFSQEQKAQMEKKILNRRVSCFVKSFGLSNHLSRKVIPESEYEAMMRGETINGRVERDRHSPTKESYAPSKFHGNPKAELTDSRRENVGAREEHGFGVAQQFFDPGYTEQSRRSKGKRMQLKQQRRVEYRKNRDDRDDPNRKRRKI